MGSVVVARDLETEEETTLDVSDVTDVYGRYMIAAEGTEEGGARGVYDIDTGGFVPLPVDGLAASAAFADDGVCYVARSEEGLSLYHCGYDGFGAEQVQVLTGDRYAFPMRICGQKVVYAALETGCYSSYEFASGETEDYDPYGTPPVFDGVIPELHTISLIEACIVVENSGIDVWEECAGDGLQTLGSETHSAEEVCELLDMAQDGVVSLGNVDGKLVVGGYRNVYFRPASE